MRKQDLSMPRIHVEAPFSLSREIFVHTMSLVGLLHPNILYYHAAPNDWHQQLYTLPSRIAYAGWTQTDIAAYAGPTPKVVSQLAEHTRKSLESTYAIAESGTAGPTGGSTRNRTPSVIP